MFLLCLLGCGADKEFWWMDQNGSFGQQGQQVKIMMMMMMMMMIIMMMMMMMMMDQNSLFKFLILFVKSIIVALEYRQPRDNL